MQANESLTETELENMTCFHRDIIEPLVQRFLDCTSKSLDELECDNFIKARPASYVEMRRLYRAFYRFQFGCNFYRATKSYENDAEGRFYLDTFLQQLDPWEKGELWSVNHFVKTQCMESFRRIGPMAEDSRREIYYEFLLDNGILESEEGFKEGHVMRGLVILQRFFLRKSIARIYENLFLDYIQS
ncbi:hypothetical protein V8C42DRAFT_360019 [Trichoderma barbatum]